MHARDLESRLEELAQRIATQLHALDEKIVFAESCTGGKMAAAITGVPGISGYFCGSAVTYRESCKTNWLEVSPSVLAQHSAESAATTAAMAEAVLGKTGEAHCSIAITGHLGPGVEKAIDGKVFIASVQRARDGQGQVEIAASVHRLMAADRKQRQTEAACLAFEHWLQRTK